MGTIIITSPESTRRDRSRSIARSHSCNPSINQSADQRLSEHIRMSKRAIESIKYPPRIHIIARIMRQAEHNRSLHYISFVFVCLVFAAIRAARGAAEPRGGAVFELHF